MNTNTEARTRKSEQGKTSKGTIQFPLDQPLPGALVKRLIRARVSEVRSRT